ncbi:stress response protein NST1-like [Helianthus annuus]|uniref:stress response protein NST1-like n=1 Tax=Helianthus annuus TaxID=4232 RepID=UPI000B8EEE5B|nr:stress response protein NST1-like [Helianthus annuus]
MFNVNEEDFKFDFEEEPNAFDINHQRDYEYNYVEDADVYDRVEVEDCTDEESMNEDTSQFPTLMEFFTEENRDELRRKVVEILKDKNFDGTTKDPLKERKKVERERKKLDENRGKWMKQQAEEEKKRKKDNDKLRNLLRRKPKSREETFKSL